MATIKGILTAMLKQEYQSKGYRLYKDEDFVYIMKDGNVLKTFNSHGVTIDTINNNIAEIEKCTAVN
jgi:DNA-binding transcriptional MerR regulator